jgi:hypothetical protein
MGNQESFSNDTYIIKKKVSKKNNKKCLDNQYENNSYQKDSYPKDSYEKDSYQNNSYQKDSYEKDFYQKDSIKKSVYKEPTQEYIDKKNVNNTLIQRNMLSDIYIKNNNYITPYPSNSNNDIDIPKTNFDNIKFTPYNFNDEVNTYKKNIDTEREQFEHNEREKRKLFENNQRIKKEFLNKEIQKFEVEYNPWKILNLKDNDYNINNIKKAYKKMALLYHPDKAGNKYEDKFQLITQSYIYLLGKAEDNNIINNKINKNVENIDYEDNINESVENIYIDKDKFDINQFNKIFDKYKIPNSFDKGYSDLMKEDIKHKDEQVFGKKFNSDIFNAHFDNIKNKKIGNEMIEYQEPEALDSSTNNLNQTFFGMNDMDDFGSMNNNNLSYTDYKKAHVDETLLIDVNKVKYKTYNSIDHLENERSSISYNPTHEDKIRYEYLERKRLEEDNLRLQHQKNYDDMISKQYKKINQKLIINK